MSNANSSPWITLSGSDSEKFFRELVSVTETADPSRTLEFLVKWFVDSSSSNVFKEIESDVLDEKRGGLSNPLCCSFSVSWVLENLNDSHFDKISKFVSFVDELAFKFGEELDDYEHGFLDLNDEQVLRYRLWEHTKVTYSCFEKSILSLMDIPKAAICRGLFKLGRDHSWRIDFLLQKQFGLDNAVLVHSEKSENTKKFYDYFDSSFAEDRKYFIEIDRIPHFDFLFRSEVIRSIDLATVEDNDFDTMVSVQSEDPTAVVILGEDYLRRLEGINGVLSFSERLKKINSGSSDNTLPLILFTNKRFSYSILDQKQKTTTVFSHLVFLLFMLQSRDAEVRGQAFIEEKDYKILSGGKDTVDSKDYLHKNFTSKKKVLRIEGRGTAPKRLFLEPNISSFILSLSSQ